MNVLFLTLCEYDSIYDRDLYTDLLRVFMEKGDSVFMVSPIEKRKRSNTYVINEGNSTILRLRIGNIQKTGLIEKGISTVTFGGIIKNGIKKYFSEIKFDLVLYSTPPITLVEAVKYVKKRDSAKTYLLLKDIFPQNAVDVGILSTTGVKGILYRHFRRQEKQLYRLSDRIGCMSQANVDYVIKHNPEVDSGVVEVCPNAIEVVDKSVSAEKRIAIRRKYDIPLDRKVYVYGGNLGKPQGISFLIECLKKCEKLEDSFFLIVGDGTEYNLLQEYVESTHQKNVKLMRRLPKEDYDTMVGACDVGMIFLDHRFTIPNFPSRLLAYMQARLPILACTDLNTDIGKVITDGRFGWWCESNNVSAFIECVYQANKSDLSIMGERSWSKLCMSYDVNDSYNVIMG